MFIIPIQYVSPEMTTQVQAEGFALNDAFKQKSQEILKFDDSVPDSIREMYQNILSEMPQDYFRAVVTNYSSIIVIDKIRKINPTINSYYVGYTSTRPPTTLIQYTRSGDSHKVRSYRDLKRNLHHEIGHVVYADYVAWLGGTNIVPPEILAAYMEDLRQLGFPKVRIVQDYYLPGGPFDTQNDRAKEAFCEIVSFITNGGDHNMNPVHGRPIDIVEDFPKTYALAQRAIGMYILRYDPFSAQP